MTYMNKTYYKKNNKDNRVAARVDAETHKLLALAFDLSGVPVSEIIRRGSKAEAKRVIRMYTNVGNVSTGGGNRNT